jgi:predicted dehydrogenase
MALTLPCESGIVVNSATPGGIVKSKKTVRLAIIGTGGMANGHASRFSAIEGSQVVACCDIVPGRAKAFAEKHQIPAFYENASEMLKKEALDGVSVVTQDRAHAEAALLALAHNVHVMCEKPLADNLKDANRMAALARRKKRLTAVNFSYRNNPATQKAAEIAASGALGRIMHVEGAYLQSWLAASFWGDWRKADNLLWRLSTRHGSAGVLGDLGVHLYDLASFVVGDFASVSCLLKTFDKGVKKIGPYVLDANDSALATVRFRNGAIGTLHTTRWATGHANTVSLRVYGYKGALDLNLDRPAPDTLKVCLGEDVETRLWMPVKCPPVPDMYQRFVTALQTGKQGQTSFDGGARVQSYLHAAAVSDRKGSAFIAIP